MSLAHAIPGFLNRQPMTGYDLTVACFEESVTWPVDQAQIYRTLDKLNEQGSLESTLEYQQDRPTQMVYNITASGCTKLQLWLVTPQPLPIHRELFLIQLFFGDRLSNETLLRLLQEQLDLYRQQLATYQQVPQQAVNAPGMIRDLILQRPTLNVESEIMYTGHP